MSRDELDKAWEVYLADRPHPHAWNPRDAFTAGWLASARSSGWSGAEEEVER